MTVVRAEFEQLRLMMHPRMPLITRSLQDEVELQTIDALAALLHSVYTALERVMLHIARAERRLDLLESRPATWHSTLLVSFSREYQGRPPMLSQQLCENLYEYLGFRHVFRHAYVHDLKWSKMKPLIARLTQTIDSFEREVFDYLLKSYQPLE